jgi:hypothetical protein
MPNPRAGDAELKSIVETTLEAEAKAPRLSRRSTPDCAAPLVTRQNAAAAASAYSPALMRELLLKVTHSCVY